MAVAIRLERVGKKKEPHYRLVAIHKSKARDGKPIEILGHYHPKQGKLFDCKLERVHYWLGVGAKMSDTVYSLFKKSGIKANQQAKEDEKTQKKSEDQTEN